MSEQLTQSQIKERIDEYNRLIEANFYPNQFTLNKEISGIVQAIENLQKQCHHEFKDGYCIYCGKKEKEE